MNLLFQCQEHNKDIRRMSSLDQLIQLQNETEKELLKYEEKERAAELYEMTDNFDVDFFRNHDSKRRMLQNAQKKIMEKNRKKNEKSKVIYLVCKIRPWIITCLPKKLLDFVVHFIALFTTKYKKCNIFCCSLRTILSHQSY